VGRIGNQKAGEEADFAGYDEMRRTVGAPMIPEMTPAVERALDYGRRLAGVAGAEEVRPEDWLHGLFAEEEGRAAAAAVAAGLDWRAYLAARPTPPACDAAFGGLSLHRATRTALREAAAWARHEVSVDASVAGDFLLVELLHADGGLRDRMAALGLDVRRLEALVLPPQAPMELDIEDGPATSMDPGATASVDRVVDACANRAREGLRVVEDYCRFVLDDAVLCGELKQLRHDLTAALIALPAQRLLTARDTPGDVGTGVTTAAESQRGSLQTVVLANWKRLQEALRSMEEFGKTYNAELGRALEQLRYRCYTLERATLLASSARRRLADVRLCVLLTGGSGRDLGRLIAEAAAGGAGMVQLREKDMSDRERLERARQVRRWTRAAGILFVVNDRADVARLADADGVHLGQEDLPMRDARRIVGPDMLIGVSTHNLEQVRQAVLDGAAYLGVGPTFSSKTKASPQLAGLDFVRAAAAETTLPTFAIGGVNADNIGAAVAAGAKRVAVSHAVAEAADPRAATAELVRALTTASQSEEKRWSRSPPIA
jgi:thiamine-phosphate pyrophosphorylase